MATTTFCDWCGELIDVPAGGDAPELKVHGRADHFFFHSPIGGFNIHAECHLGEYGTIDPDCCLGKLEAFLRERASWAHDPDQQSQEWRLVPREGRTLTAGDKRRAARELELSRRAAEADERDAAWAAWQKLTRGERLEMIRGQLAGERLTVRETAERLKAEFPEICVYEQYIRPLMAQMLSSGELTREGERWRSGHGPSSIRYRYTLTAGGES